MGLTAKIIERARQLNKTIVLCEGNDPRVFEAAQKIAAQKIAKIKLIADSITLKGELNEGITLIDPCEIDLTKYSELLFKLRKEKGMTHEQAQELVYNPLYLGALMVQCGEADGMVAGAANSTGDVLRPALQIIKTAKDMSVVSSCFIMVLEEGSKYGENGIMVFGDCAIIPEPNVAQLASIALASAQSAKKIAEIEPRVAMLSFSTKGSAKHPLAEKVISATKLAREIDPKLPIDGELQADAAIVGPVAKLKAPKSNVAGSANVLIFPDLQSGNIGYKLVERLAGAKALGPICQGFNKPVNDLSRGCNVEDVIGVVAITAIQAG